MVEYDLGSRWMPISATPMKFGARIEYTCTQACMGACACGCVHACVRYVRACVHVHVRTQYMWSVCAHAFMQGACAWCMHACVRVSMCVCQYTVRVRACVRA